MRTFIVTLLFAAAPIYLGITTFSGNPAFSPASFSGAANQRDEIGSRNDLRDVIAQTRDHAAVRPEMVQEPKTDRAEIENFRSTVCASVRC